jgi:salicylate hydroxylase
VLGALLSKSSITRKTLDSALEVYDKVRVAEGRRVIRGSRLTGFLFEFNGPMGEDLAACAQMVEKQSAWVSKKDPEEDVETACAMLKC